MFCVGAKLVLLPQKKNTHEASLFEDRVLTKILEVPRDEVTRGWRREAL
jgi:hypothetical protein